MVFAGKPWTQEHTQELHKGTGTQYSIFVVDKEHANGGSQRSSVPKQFSLWAHNQFSQRVIGFGFEGKKLNGFRFQTINGFQ